MAKVFELIIYNTMLSYFSKNNLISKNQSGLKPGDSLLTITHEIYIPALMKITKLEGYYLIFQKLSIKCGTRGLFVNLNAG